MTSRLREYGKNVKFLLLILVITISSLTVFTLYADMLPSTDEKEAFQIARDFVRNDPTFRFDGIEETLKHIETLQRCPYCHLRNIETYTFVFTFDSRHPGYGDRTGQVLATVITSHTANMTVYEDEVILAIMDGRWDMISQEII
ncbi:hypothetical protein [[Eubacterium] cellulosolvens]